MSAEQPVAASSSDLPATPEANASLPAADTASAPTSAGAASAETRAENDSDKPRIKIGSQRDGSTAKVPPRVITEFKTPAGGAAPKKQVFVSLDQEGKFQPLAAPSTPAASSAAPLNPAAMKPAPREQRPPQPLVNHNSNVRRAPGSRCLG